MSWKWYGVRTLFRTQATGRPVGTDEDYSEDATLVEDRVVLVRARSFDEAIQKAESEAHKYAAEVSHRNPYGQRVKRRYLRYCDAFEMWADPANREEVFSSTEVVVLKESDEAIIDRVIGSKETTTDRRRRNILNVMFDKPAPGVTRTPEEGSSRKRQHKKRGSDA